jgi:hypothetical protein
MDLPAVRLENQLKRRKEAKDMSLSVYRLYVPLAPLLVAAHCGSAYGQQDLSVNGKLIATELEVGDHNASACLQSTPGGLCLLWGAATALTTGLHVTKENTTFGIPAIFRSSISFGTQENQMLNLFSTNYGIGVQDWGLYLRSDRDFYWYKGGRQQYAKDGRGDGVTLMHLDGNGNLQTGGAVSTSGVQVVAIWPNRFQYRIETFPKGQYSSSMSGIPGG